MQANAILFDRYRIENLLRSGIERLGGTVEYGTELRGFEQFPDRVDAVLLTSQGQPELLSCHWLVGADGAEGIVSLLDTRKPTARGWHSDSALGITRQELGLSFLGETRHGEPMVLGMIEVQGLASEVRILVLAMGIAQSDFKHPVVLAPVGLPHSRRVSGSIPTCYVTRLNRLTD